MLPRTTIWPQDWAGASHNHVSGHFSASMKKSAELVIRLLGFDDPWIWGVYLLCILSALLCLVYGIINWNREGELEALEIKEEAAWEANEEEMQEKELGL